MLLGLFWRIYKSFYPIWLYSSTGGLFQGFILFLFIVLVCQMFLLLLFFFIINYDLQNLSCICIYKYIKRKVTCLRFFSFEYVCVCIYIYIKDQHSLKTRRTSQSLMIRLTLLLRFSPNDIVLNYNSKILFFTNSFEFIKIYSSPPTTHPLICMHPHLIQFNKLQITLPTLSILIYSIKKSIFQKIIYN